MAHLRASDGSIDIVDDTGSVLIGGCLGAAQLSNGVSFPMDAMHPNTAVTGAMARSTAGGGALPLLEWQLELTGHSSAEATLRITNETNHPIYIDRLDILVSSSGYRATPSSNLLLRRTGWQMSTPATPRVHFTDRDPWVQPPLYMPAVPAPTGDAWQLPWMTVLQSANTEPLLMGFKTATDYLGMITVESSNTGHYITASNHLEGTVIAPGETISSEPFVLLWDDDEHKLLDTYGDLVGTAMHARFPSHTPTGWSHWLYYFANVTEDDILENTQLIHQKNLPLEYIQVDDGYQTYIGDWLSISGKFPHGMKYIADAIRDTGRKPGIWLSPFMADARSEVVRKHPDWFLHDVKGNLINVNRLGDSYWPAPNYGLDITHPDAYAWLHHVLTTMCETWGYDYLKLDFIYAGAIQAVRHNQSITSVQAYRKGMELIRTIAGERILLGCGAPLLCSVGLVDSMRIGPDLGWEKELSDAPQPMDITVPTSRDPLLSLFSHDWMNKKLWINDADYVRLRQHRINLDWQQAVALTCLIALGGGALYDSDKLSTLEPEGYASLHRLIPVASIRSRAVSAVEGKPTHQIAGVSQGHGIWHIAANFNWDTAPSNSRFTPAEWDLPDGGYHIYDLLGETYLGLYTSHDFGSLASHNVNLFSLCPASVVPQVVATKGHLMGPAGDIANVSWHNNQLTMHLIPGRAPVTIYIHVPEAFTVSGHTGCKLGALDSGILAVIPNSMACSLSFQTTQ